MYDFHIWPEWQPYSWHFQRAMSDWFQILHQVFYSTNLHDSKVRQGEHFTQANKTRHYTPHKVWKSYFP